MAIETQTTSMALPTIGSLVPPFSARSPNLVWGSFTVTLLIFVAACIFIFKQVGVGYATVVPLILGNQTNLRANYIASETRMANQLLVQMALRYAAEGNQLDLKALVSRGVINDNIFAKVQIVDAQGNLLLSSIETPTGLNFSHTKAFRAHASNNNGRMFIEASAFGSGSPRNFAGFSQRLTDTNGNFLGVVLTSFKAEHISRVVDDLQRRFNGVSHLMGLDGQIISPLLAQDAQTVYDYTDHPFPKLIRQGDTHGSYEAQFGGSGASRIFVYRKIPALDLVVVSSVAKRGWDSMLPSTKSAFLASAVMLLLAFSLLILAFRTHTASLNKALAQKKLLAEQLKSSEERLSLAVTSGRLGTWDWRLRDKRFRTNEVFNTLLKSWPNEIDLESDVLHRQIHPEDLAAFVLSVRQHMRGEQFDLFIECRMQNPAGDWIWVRVVGRVTERGPDRGPIRISGIVMDISEQRSLQNQLEDHSNQLATIFSTSQDALVVFDQNRRIKFVNPAFKKLTQLEPSALLGLDETQLTHQLNKMCEPDKHFCGFPALRAPADVASARMQESFVLRSPVARVLRATLTTSNSISVSEILSLRDVTHETMLEKLRSEFLSTAAHEIRSPMSSILGFAELMTNTELNVSHRREFSNIIVSQAHRIKGLLDELLDLARIDASGDQHFVFKAVDLRDLVQTVVAEFMPPDGRPAPTVDIPSQQCRIDFDKAVQVLVNVVSNAFKYSGKNSTVNICYAPPTTVNRQKMAGIIVQDTGIGMLEEEQQKIFERFYRANQKFAVAGSGLGMAIVKEIMTRHGGEVIINSVFGQGTSVTLLFPMVKQMDLLAAPALVKPSEPV